MPAKRSTYSRCSSRLVALTTLPGAPKTMLSTASNSSASVSVLPVPKRTSDTFSRVIMFVAKSALSVLTCTWVCARNTGSVPNG